MASVFCMCDIVGVFSGWSGQQMNAVKPFVRACTSRTRSRCSMRSASVSPMPYIIVTDVFIPSWCAISMISSQRSAPAFFLRDQIAHALDEDLAAAAGDRVEPGLHQLADDVARVHAERLGEEVDFARAEAVDVDRMVLLDVAQQIEIPLERDVRVVPALHENLDRRPSPSLRRSWRRSARTRASSLRRASAGGRTRRSRSRRRRRSCS